MNTLTLLRNDPECDAETRILDQFDNVGVWHVDDRLIVDGQYAVSNLQLPTVVCRTSLNDPSNLMRHSWWHIRVQVLCKTLDSDLRTSVGATEHCNQPLQTSNRGVSINKIQVYKDMLHFLWRCGLRRDQPEWAIYSVWDKMLKEYCGVKTRLVYWVISQLRKWASLRWCI